MWEQGQKRRCLGWKREGGSVLPSLGLNSQPRSDLVTVAQGGQELILVT